MTWIIYYDDGSTYSSDDGPPEDAPVDGVQVIMQALSDGGRRIVQGGDYYWWLGDEWASGALVDLERRLRAAIPSIKFGRWMSSDGYAAIVRRAMKR